MIKNILQVVIILLIVSCKEQVKKKVNAQDSFKPVKKEVIGVKDSIKLPKEEVVSQKDTLPLIDSVQNDSIKIDTIEAISIDSAQKRTTDIDYISVENYEYNIKDFVIDAGFAKFNDYTYYSIIPIILNHQDIYYTESDYPDELVLRIIPNSIDTLEVVSGNYDCYDCLNFLKIQDAKGKELFYQYTVGKETVLVQDGDLNTILNTRNLTTEDLNNSKFIVANDNNWKPDLSDYLENEYVFYTKLKYIYLPNVEQANKIVERNLIKKFKDSIYPIDTIKAYYQNILEKKGDITIDNFLHYYKRQKYDHSGGINKNENIPNVLLLVDSIKIFYISKTNKIYTINYLQNISEYLTNDTHPITDGFARIIDNSYKIGGSEKMINLFHQDMVEGEYVVFYQLKPKHIDTYIYSPIETITYKKPK